jgi:hypothetical protein
MQDRYTWLVTYSDGTNTEEFDDARPDGRGWAEIEQDKSVKSIALLPTIPFDDVAHTVLIPDGATPIFFRRRTIALDGSGSEQERTTAHCIGWKREEQAVYLFVFPDGSTLLSDDLQAV